MHQSPQRLTDCIPADLEQAGKLQLSRDPGAYRPFPRGQLLPQLVGDLRGESRRSARLPQSIHGDLQMLDI
ncbi:hypothetical protein GCM10009647_083050 [Streptomyces sanglieri]